MKDILAAIENKKQEFSQLPLFDFMRNKNIDPRQRLAWAPCAAPFVMSFGELNKHFLRVEPTNDPLQEIINNYTYEDDFHWLWFLEDLKNLELDKSLRFSEALKFLWSEETKNTRWLSYQLYRHTSEATPIQKLVVIEVMEATGNATLSIAAEVSKELKAITQKEYQYLGESHVDVENDHALWSSNIDQFIKNIELSEESQKEAFELVDKLFTAFTDFTNELLAYAQKQKIEQPMSIT